MSRLSLLITVATLPVFLILLYIYQKDKNKEPTKLLLKLFGCGILTCFIVLIISTLLNPIFPFMGKEPTDMNFLEVLIYSFVIVALLEESCKWVMVYNVGYKNSHFDEIYDIMVYSVFVSLGFAFFENLLYVLLNDSLLVGVFRGVLAIPGHACDAIFMGYYLSLAKIYSKKGNKSLEKKNIVLSILIPTILHGIYDFCLFADIVLLVLVFFVFIVFLYTISIKKLKKVAESTEQLKERNKFCPNCGRIVTGPFCGNCGRKQD